MILALKQQSRIYLASDSMNQEGDQVYYNCSKIHKHQSNEVLMAGVGNSKIVKEVLSNCFFNGTLPDMESCSIYLDQLIKTFKEEHPVYFQFFVAGNGKLFLLSDSGMIVDVPEFEALGKNRSMAMVGLDITYDLPPDQRLRKVISTCMKYDPYIGGDINIQFV